MSTNEQIKFEPFEQLGQVLQEERRPYNGTTATINSPLDHHQNHLELCTRTDNNKTVTCRYTLSLVLFISVVFLLAFTFFTVVAFIVKCDESKLIDHYEQRKAFIEKAVSDFSMTWQQRQLERNENDKPQKIKWIPFGKFVTNIMAKCEPAGIELFQSKNVLLFVARTQHENGFVVGKQFFFYKTMFFGYLGKEQEAANFEILSYPPGTLSWIPANKSSVPCEDALISGGRAPRTGESTYICRAKHNTNLVIGKYLASSEGCLVSYSTTEHLKDGFEILAVNQRGRFMGVASQ